MSEKAGRLEVLDGLRGIAAFIVIGWHCSLGFFPQITGFFDNFPPNLSWAGKPWFILINGNAAVVFFFVLSGFVLTFRALMTRDSLQITTGVIKRWPRLAVPVAISTLVSGLIFYFDLYSFKDAGALSGSPWLTQFGYAAEVPYDRSVADAISQGLFFTFFRGDSYFNSSLWTIRYEFIGSFIVFGLAYFMIAADMRRLFVFYLWLTALLVCFYISPYYVSFLLGLSISLVYPYVRGQGTTIKFIFCFVGLFCVSYSKPTGIFVIFAGINSIYVQSIGSILIILAFIEMVPRGFMLKCARLLGEMSFPLYLMHFPVLASVGSAVYVAYFHDDAVLAAYYATGVTVFVSVLAAYPVLVVNRIWVPFLNGFVNKWIMRTSSPVSTV